MNKTFSPEKLRQLRDQKKYSLNDLSLQIYANKGVKISGQTIYNWEKGKNLPQIEHLMCLADFFKKPLEYFFVSKPNKRFRSSLS